MLSRRTAILSASAGLAVACTDGPAPVSQKSDYNTTLKPLPFAVQEIYPAAHKGRIHIAGGLLAEGGRAVAASSHHIAYDPKTQNTSSLASLPAPRHHPHIVDHKGRLYLFGGFGANPGAINWIMSADTLVYDDSA
ncbi:MAG: galactose oxidase, partial [Hyphomonadaceae bacterium]|nr:galactose oxidase [Hyphomonadaceae bacterium]